MALPTPTSRYAEITARMEHFTSMGGVLLLVAIVASLAGDRRALVSVGVVQALLLGGNFAYNRYLIDRLGRPGDIVRQLTSCALALMVGHLSHWTLAVWFSLPLIALITDPLAGKLGTFNLVVLCVSQAALGAAEGAAWSCVLGFPVLAGFCFAVVRSRGAALRGMLVETDQQHAQLVRAHRRLKFAVEARDRMELELRQAQKLEAMGRLAAGVAHEINTPVQFVSDSVLFVKTSLDETLPLIRAYQTLRRHVSVLSGAKKLIAPVVAAEEAADIEYVLANIPSALDRTLDGIQRIATIVKSLKEFAHPDGNDMAPVDLNRAIESTLTIAKHEYRPFADLDLTLATLPSVTCHAGEINQVVLNIVVNAAHAIEDVLKDNPGCERGTIRVSTKTEGSGDDEGVLITISDTGGGIPESVRERVFDPFFTTKEVGRGTGQGLAIARTVVEKHGGKITFATELGRGTTFFIRLPLVPPPSASQTGAYCTVPTERAA